MRAKAAFEILSASIDHKAGDEGPHSQRCRPGDRVAPRRPNSATKTDVRIDKLTAEDQEECYALLASQPSSDTTDHVVEAVQRQGRHLVYIVTSEIAAGQNRVALPAEILATNRKVPPSIVCFEVTGRNVGDIVIPESTRLEVFPEARSVRIRFQSAPCCH